MYPLKTTPTRHKPCRPQTATLSEAARRIAYAEQRQRWEILIQMSSDIDQSLALYFSGVRHPAQDLPEFADWLQNLIDAEESLSARMADCIDKLSALSEVR